MPLPRSAVRRARRKDEVSSLLGWNGGAEDAADGDDWPTRSVTCIAQRPPWVLPDSGDRGASGDSEGHVDRFGPRLVIEQ